MKRLLRKILVVVVLFAALFINTDCKKQKRCGCRGDVLYGYQNETEVYFSDETSTIMMYVINSYGSVDQFTFCNPDEIRPKLEKFKSGVDALVVLGNVYWDCNYVMQASSNPYYGYGYGAAYNIYVTDIYMDMYGKDDNDETIKRAQ